MPVQTEAPYQAPTLLVVDDRQENLVAMEALLENSAWQVRSAASGEAALRCLLENEVELVLLDVHLGSHHHGPDVYTELCQRWGQTPAVILVTAERDATLRRQAAESGWGFLAKPVRAPALRALMSQTLLRLRESNTP